ncbi:MAG: hypothetical protein NT031_06375 [Planctomycetota bacterium]|nr:hypothetical protein [Planctomycetota bacterium]
MFIAAHPLNRANAAASTTSSRHRSASRISSSIRSRRRFFLRESSRNCMAAHTRGRYRVRLSR